MTQSNNSERRKHERFETDLKIQFEVTFDIQTKVDFVIKDKTATTRKKYSAISRNVSVEGLAFESPKNLLCGDKLSLEVYVPSSDTPIRMEGDVRWSQPLLGRPNIYKTGVLISTVEGKAVAETIFFDPEHKILWSVVLESVLGQFKDLMLKRRDLGPKP